ncbi:MAG: 16S rRNA (adenine(1518)-N(6)/adenine(1519)-N(6))-dimethyltransferase RsmA [Candidatus Heimdallarchaeota archaeon]|nr:MAG: ribosomal RNA small subunit methyltransferase A [Candidatus Gerdarchaeota archaeon]RLI72477.1 MAG: ribosomal RNA small subunit methyltransferase A [Candidatus Heimdallarchaeota archaeon]
MTSLIAKTRDALIAAGISPKKSLSQNFIINEHYLQKHINHAKITHKDVILEIGGGTGILTERLAEKAKKIFSIEYDGNLAAFLKQKFRNKKNVIIIEGDALKVAWPEATKIIANLPYHLSSPITFKLLEQQFSLAILMYQYEFAKRMIAQPNSPDYSRLTVNLQYQADVTILERVSRTAFYPQPRVDSALVKITLKNHELPVPIPVFRGITRILFNTKNKLVSTVLYDYFKRIIPKQKRSRFRAFFNSKLQKASSRVRELTETDIVCICQDILPFLEKEQLLEALG